MEADFVRKMPASIEAEQAVLGSILIKPEAFETVAGILKAEDFYAEDHKAVFSAMRDMFLQSKKIDAVTLINNMKALGTYTDDNLLVYVKNLLGAVPTASNIKDYAKIVAEKATLRRLITTCEEILDTAYSAEGDVNHIVDSAEQQIFDIAQKRDTKEFRHIRDLMPEVYQNLEALSESKGKVSGAKTGFSDLDHVLVQLGKGNMVLIGARPGMGKTSFAMNVGTNYAKASGKAVCVFSLEMSCEEIVQRLLSSEAMVDSRSLRSGEIKPDDWQKLAGAAEILSGCDLLIDDTTGITVTDMKAKLRRVKNLGMVIIDYLQLMQSGKGIENRVQEVAEISRNLKIMAKDLGVPVICCAQLSRGPEGRTDKKPMLSDLRDSGSIEQDADIVMFLYRDEYYKVGETEGNTAGDSTAEVIIAKNRHGSTGSVKMGWIGQFTKFRTLAMDEVAP